MASEYDKKQEARRWSHVDLFGEKATNVAAALSRKHAHAQFPSSCSAHLSIRSADVRRHISYAGRGSMTRLIAAVRAALRSSAHGSRGHLTGMYWA